MGAGGGARKNIIFFLGRGWYCGVTSQQTTERLAITTPRYTRRPSPHLRRTSAVPLHSSLSGEVGDIDFVDSPPRLRQTIAVPRCGEGMARWALAARGEERLAAARE